MTRSRSKSNKSSINVADTSRVEELKHALPIAQNLQRAILRQGTSLIEKNLIKHLNAFRMCIVKDGPDVKLFTHPAALTKLALWVGEAVAQKEREKKGKLGHGGRGTPFVIVGLNESRGVYVVVGTGGGGGLGFGDRIAAKEKQQKQEAKAKARELKQKNKEKIREEKRAARRKAAEDDEDEDQTESEASESSESEEESDEEEESQVKGFGRNKFGNAFQEVVEETNARVRIDSFEHCVVEVKKEDLAGFLESLSMKAVVG